MPTTEDVVMFPNRKVHHGGWFVEGMIKSAMLSIVVTLSSLILMVTLYDLHTMWTSGYLDTKIQGLDILLENVKERFHTPLKIQATISLRSFLHTMKVRAEESSCAIYSATTSADGTPPTRSWITGVSLMSPISIDSTTTTTTTTATTTRNNKSQLRSDPSTRSQRAPSTGSSDDNTQDINLAFYDTSAPALRKIIRGLPDASFLPEVTCEADIVLYAFKIIPIPLRYYFSWDAERSTRSSFRQAPSLFHQYSPEKLAATRKQMASFLSELSTALSKSTAAATTTPSSMTATAASSSSSSSSSLKSSPKETAPSPESPESSSFPSFHRMLESTVSLVGESSFLVNNNDTIHLSTTVLAHSSVPFPVKIQALPIDVSVRSLRADDPDHYKVQIDGFSLALHPTVSSTLSTSVKVHCLNRGDKAHEGRQGRGPSPSPGGGSTSATSGCADPAPLRRLVDEITSDKESHLVASYAGSKVFLYDFLSSFMHQHPVTQVQFLYKLLTGRGRGHTAFAQVGKGDRNIPRGKKTHVNPFKTKSKVAFTHALSTGASGTNVNNNNDNKRHAPQPTGATVTRTPSCVMSNEEKDQRPSLRRRRSTQADVPTPTATERHATSTTVKPIGTPKHASPPQPKTTTKANTASATTTVANYKTHGPFPMDNPLNPHIRQQ